MPFIIILAVLAIITVIRCIRIVPQGYSWVTELLGKYRTTWKAGLHLKIPFIERVAKKVTMKECTLDYEPQSVITSDNATIRVDAIVFYQVFDPKLYTYGAEDPILAMKQLTSTSLRNCIGGLDFDKVLSSRDIINEQMTKLLDEATDPWGIKVLRVELKSLEPPADIRDAMAKQLKADRERRQTELEAEAHKKAAITRAEGDKQAMILKAEAERDAAIARAEGEARSIAMVYEAEAAGIQKLNEASPNSQVLSLKGIDALKEIANGNATKIFVPTELAGLVSLAGAIGEAAGLGSAMPVAAKPKLDKKSTDDCCDDDSYGHSAVTNAVKSGTVSDDVSNDYTASRETQRMTTMTDHK